MKSSSKVSVIILVHNKIDMTRLCLESLAIALRQIDHEVILLDNGSTEDISSLQDCGRLFGRQVILRSDKNLSFSAGNNRCTGSASGDIFLFLNNDVFLAPVSLDPIIERITEDDSAGIVGGMLLFPDKTSVQHAGMKQMLWGFPSNYGVGAQSSDARINNAEEIFAVTGALQCVKRDIFQRVEGFDERYIWGCEDVDICLKVRSCGYRVIYEPRAVGIHEESATLKVTKNRDSAGNYNIFRRTWDTVLVPRELEYIRNLKTLGTKAVAVYGTGSAALGLTNILEKNGIQVIAYTSSKCDSCGEAFLGRPLVPRTSLHGMKYDRLMVASQFYFAVEESIKNLDPRGAPIFPVLE